MAVQREEGMVQVVPPPPLTHPAVRILLVDDNPHDREFVVRELGRVLPQARVYGAMDADELDRRLNKEVFDVAIMDYQLRCCTGLDVLRRIKARLPECIVIMFTASGSEEVAVAAMKEGLDDYIVKTPRHFARIPLAVAAAIERRRQRQEAAAARLAQQRSDERLRCIVQASNESLWDFDVAAGTLWWSERDNPIYGYAPEQLEAGMEALWSRVHADDRDRVVRHFASCLVGTGPAWSDEFRLRRADGSHVHILSRGRAAADAAGRVYRVFGTLIDISERKRVEEALREADRRKNEFLAVLAHELRNPLAPIRHSLRILQLSGPAGTSPALQIMERQVTHMVRLIDDLLDVSRIDRDALPLQLAHTTMSDILDDAIETCRPQMEAAGHRFEQSLPCEVIPMYADRMRLAQVFSNLLANSTKYMDAGGCIRVAVSRDADEVVVSVTDQGAGIAAEDLPRVFDMFTRARHGTHHADGLGIGLALVRSLVRLHGGSISAHSEGPGRGSVFSVRLPVADHASGAQAVPSMHPVAPGAVAQRVLVADDSEDCRESMRELLECMGHEVCTACDGVEAVRLSQSFHPGVIFMDVSMPNVSGLEAAARIRATDWGRNIAIYALTGFGQLRDRECSHAAGINRHLVKPVGWQELAACLAVAGPPDLQAAQAVTSVPRAQESS